jgi:hypothetical protein
MYALLILASLIYPSSASPIAAPLSQIQDIVHSRVVSVKCKSFSQEEESEGLSLAKRSNCLERKLALIPRGGGLIPAGYNPFGYKITELGLAFLEFKGSIDSDIGRFLASLKSGRKTKDRLKEQWLEILRVGKTGQTLRVYKDLDVFLSFCLKAGLVN